MGKLHEPSPAHCRTYTRWALPHNTPVFLTPTGLSAPSSSLCSIIRSSILMTERPASLISLAFQLQYGTCEWTEIGTALPPIVLTASPCQCPQRPVSMAALCVSTEDLPANFEREQLV